jgi:hypothetical protein
MYLLVDVPMLPSLLDVNLHTNLNARLAAHDISVLGEDRGEHHPQAAKQGGALVDVALRA